MKQYIKIFLIGIFLFFIAGSIIAQDSTRVKKQPSKTGVEHHKGKGFVDANGDGYNDNAPDHDGDGIPNGLDPDYIKLKKRGRMGVGYIDSDGDGINDNMQFMHRHGHMGTNKFKRHIHPQNLHDGRISTGSGRGKHIGGGTGTNDGSGGHRHGGNRGKGRGK